jgi:hypothetical protein
MPNKKKKNLATKKPAGSEQAGDADDDFLNEAFEHNAVLRKVHDAAAQEQEEENAEDREAEEKRRRRAADDDDIIDESAIDMFERFFHCTPPSPTHTLAECLGFSARNDPSGKCVQHCISELTRLGQLADVINFRDPDVGVTALHLACLRGLPRNIQPLLAAGSRFDILDNAGTEPYWSLVQGTCNKAAYGSEKDFLDGVLLFRAHGYPDLTRCIASGRQDSPTLPAAAEFGFRRLCKLLLDSGADVNERSCIPFGSASEARQQGCPSPGLTPLHQAVFSGKVSLVKTLLKAGADTRKRALGNSASLPVEYWNFNARVADVVLRWEEDHGVLTEGDCPPHGAASEMAMFTIRNEVERYRQSGDVKGGLGGMSPDRVFAMPTGARGLEEEDGVRTAARAMKQEVLGAMAKTGKEADRLDADCAHLRKVCAFPGCPSGSSKGGAAARFDMKKCSGCGKVYYCGKDCQLGHWKAGHKKECKMFKERGL